MKITILEETIGGRPGEWTAGLVSYPCIRRHVQGSKLFVEDLCLRECSCLHSKDMSSRQNMTFVHVSVFVKVVGTIREKRLAPQ